VHYGLGPRMQDVVDQYRASGFGYADYADQIGWGICVADPKWFAKRILESNDFIQILLQEKGLDNHHDIQAFMRSSLLDDRRGPLLDAGFRPKKADSSQLIGADPQTTFLRYLLWWKI